MRSRPFDLPISALFSSLAALGGLAYNGIAVAYHFKGETTLRRVFPFLEQYPGAAVARALKE
jgi:hypothetical protein